jgi:type IV secretory pathway TraG/TraD family ATPase VirD4
MRSGRHWVWSSIEDVTLRLGGPRTGKTGEIACRLLDAPGAVIATSTRTDLCDLTADVRSRIGPVTIFNPSGLAGLPTSIKFNPVAGCEDIALATHRASDLLAPSTHGGFGADRDFWSGQAERVLRCLLHAAALGDRPMRDVLSWVADPDRAGDVRRLLRKSPVPTVEDDAAQFLGTNDRTRSSICATMMPALRWLSDPAAADVAQGDGFDVAAFLRARGTLYLLGTDDATVAPLLTAFTGHIAREARALAAHQPGGRLDPPLTLVLDEAALICPIPLDRWTADMGGRNITIHIAAQSRAQLRQRWGDTGAAAILNNAATVLIFGGTRDPGDLAAYATLAGERIEEVRTQDGSGRTASISYRRVPILTPAQIAQLPAGRVVAIRRGLRPVIGTTRMAWERPDVRAVQRRTKSVGRGR